MARRTLLTTSTDVSALSASFPELDLAAIDSAIADIPVRKIRTQTTEAQALLPVAQYYASQRPDLAGAEIGQQIRAGYKGDFKLTPGFDREVARLLKDSSKATSARTPKPANKAAVVEAAPAASISAAATAVIDAEEMADLLAPVSSRSAASPAAASGTNTTAHHDDPGLSRPYKFFGIFLSPVRDTGFSAVTEFYDAVERDLPMSLIVDRAQTIRRNPSAEAALRTFAKEDRDIFDAVVKSVKQ